jgi:hypothetical protein
MRRGEVAGLVVIEVGIRHHGGVPQQRKAGIEVAGGVFAGPDDRQADRSAHRIFNPQNASICATMAVSVGRRSIELAP